jgi:phage terminase large subunit
MADTMETADFVAMLLKQAQREETAYIDVIGLGAGVYDRLRQQQYRVYPHNSSERAYDNERFHNRRAEVYWMAREMADRGELDLPGDGEDDDLIAQLGSIKWKVTAGGRILLESKEDMKARGLPSPDRADAAIMALIRGHQIRAIDLPEDTDSSITSGLMDRII